MNYLRVPALLLIAALLASCTPAPDATPPAGQQPPAAAALPPQAAPARAAPCLARGAFPPLLPGLRYGVNAFLFGTDQERVLQLTRSAGFGWARQQIHWRDMEAQPGVYNWGALDLALRQAEQHGVQLLVSVVQSPAGATARGQGGLPDDPAMLGRFMRALATRYAGRIAAYEIWNEPNLAVENGGVVPMPAHYLRVLQAANSAIKAADPCALVLAAPLAATATNDPAVAADDLAFYRELYTYDDGAFLHAADALALHPGGGPHAFDALWSSSAPQQSRAYFRHIEQVRAIMEQHGDQRQAWITEVGWATQRAPGAPLPVSPQQQATNLVGALELIRSEYPWVVAVFVWNLNFSVLGAADDEKSTFGILNADWSPRPAYLALQEYLHMRAVIEQQNAPRFSADAPYQQAWQFRARGKSRAAPVVASDGSTYTVSDPGHLYALSPFGALRWAFDPPGETRDAPALGADGTLYLGDGSGHLSALRPDGTLRWQRALGQAIRGSPIVTVDRLYVSTGDAVLQLDHAGAVQWRVSLDNAGPPLLGQDAATLYLTTATGDVVALATDGTPRWRTAIGRAVSSAAAYAPGHGGQAARVLVGDAGGYLSSLDAASGQLRWQRKLVQRVESETLLATSPLIGAPPLITADGTIYLSGRDGTLSALDASGALLWRHSGGGDLSATATQAPDGTLYVTSMELGLLAIGADGRLLWQAKLRGATRSQPVAMPDGTLYVTALSGTLYALVERGE